MTMTSGARVLALAVILVAPGTAIAQETPCASAPELMHETLDDNTEMDRVTVLLEESVRIRKKIQAEREFLANYNTTVVDNETFDAMTQVADKELEAVGILLNEWSVMRIGMAMVIFDCSQ